MSTANWGHAGVCQFMTPNDTGHKLATATIPIKAFALLGMVFVISISE
jgi:hypothetical protein